MRNANLVNIYNFQNWIAQGALSEHTNFCGRFHKVNSTIEFTMTELCYMPLSIKLDKHNIFQILDLPTPHPRFSPILGEDNWSTKILFLDSPTPNRFKCQLPGYLMKWLGVFVNFRSI